MEAAEGQPVEPGRDLGFNALRLGFIDGLVQGRSPRSCGNAWRAIWLREKPVGNV
jgi:hypothetical protein